MAASGSVAEDRQEVSPQMALTSVEVSKLKIRLTTFDLQACMELVTILESRKIETCLIACGHILSTFDTWSRPLCYPLLRCEGMRLT
ncbi:hypothetical protein V6N13_068305 [Hibiscus sabdariffa]